jgi:hypothetical protein
MLKKLLIDSWSFFKNHVVAISVIVLPIVVPIEIFTAFYQYFYTSDEFIWLEQILPMSLWALAYPVYTVGVIFYIASIISGKRSDTKTLWRLGIKFWVPYFILISIVGAGVLLGLMLLIIPGILLTVRLAFSEFDLLLNQSKPLDAIKNSWASTREYIWVILGGYVVITIYLYAPLYLISLLFEESSISYWVFDTVSSIVYSVLEVLYTIFAFRVYVLVDEQR